MAVTCSFEKKYGKMSLLDSEGHPHRMDVWAGGNCIMVVTSKEKVLQFFASDLKHLRRCSDLVPGFIEEASFSMDLPYAKDIAAILAKAGCVVTLYPSSHKFR